MNDRVFRTRTGILFVFLFGAITIGYNWPVNASFSRPLTGQASFPTNTLEATMTGDTGSFQIFHPNTAIPVTFVPGAGTFESLNPKTDVSVEQATVTQQATAITTSCVISPCNDPSCRGNDPGLPTPADSPVSDQKAGSVLFYNFYSSSINAPSIENTRINITNTAQGTVFVHLFFVDGSSCSVADSYVCLSANQTTMVLASDYDPGVKGYLVAVAVDTNGCPIQWNFLLGDEYIKLASGHAANLGAEAFAAVVPNPTGCSPANNSATILFDNAHYNLAPLVLAADHFASNLEGNSTLFILNRLGGDLRATADFIGPVFGVLFDDLETSFSFSFTGNSCQFTRILSNTFPRTTPRLDTIIPIGQGGWMKFRSTQNNGLLGAMLTFNPNAASGNNAYSQGHNLHKLTLGGVAQFIIPVFPPQS